MNGQDAILAFDWSGKRLWEQTLGAERPGKNKNGSGSNPSPVTDGQNVFVYFKSGNLAALSVDGQVRWKTNLVERYGRDTLYWDYGSSPVLTEKDVVIALMHHGESWLAAFDKSTGNLHWKVSRNYETPDEGDHSYATPVLIRHDGTRGDVRLPPPLLGEHSHEILSEAGFEPSEIEALARSGVI